MRDEPNARLRCRNARSSDTTKGVDSSRQPDGGHGSRKPLRSVLFDGIVIIDNKPLLYAPDIERFYRVERGEIQTFERLYRSKLVEAPLTLGLIAYYEPNLR